MPLTPQERADAAAHQYRRRRELEAAARAGELQQPVEGDGPQRWAYEVAERYAARIGHPIDKRSKAGVERWDRMARRIQEAYSDDVRDLLVESPTILINRARSAGIGFEKSGEEFAVSAYLYQGD